MKILGFLQNSFVDFPKQIAAVIFTGGCNFSCYYCHNKELIQACEEKFSEEKVLKFLESRKSFLEGVVISGGEPTLQEDLKNFIIKIKSLGLMVKLDTNGSNPEVLIELINENLLDYIAMDIKSAFVNLKKIANADKFENQILQSVKLVKECNVEHEFRTTACNLLSKNDFLSIAKLVGNSKWAIQKLNFDFVSEKHKSFADNIDFKLIINELKKNAPNVFLRGF